MNDHHKDGLDYSNDNISMSEYYPDGNALVKCQPTSSIKKIIFIHLVTLQITMNTRFKHDLES